MAFDTRKMLFPAQIAARERSKQRRPSNSSASTFLALAMGIALSTQVMHPSPPRYPNKNKVKKN